MDKIIKKQLILTVATAACTHSGKYTVRVTDTHGQDETATIDVVVRGQFFSYFVIFVSPKFFS